MKSIVTEVLAKRRTDMLVSTTDIQDFIVDEYVTIAIGAGIISSGVLRDWAAKIKDFTGGTPTGYVDDFEQTIKDAINNMVDNALKHGIDAIIGVDVDITTLSTDKGGFFVVSAYGTAVKGHKKNITNDQTSQLKTTYQGDHATDEKDPATKGDGNDPSRSSTHTDNS